MKLPIYLDYAATTPVDPQVAEKMSQYLTSSGIFGNPSSTHAYGLAAKEAIEAARTEVAELIHAESSEIVWTSGTTEANNLALKGAAQLYRAKGKHIVTLKTEHPAVLDCCQQLEKEGFLVTYLAPESNGVLDIEKLKHAIRPDTILVSIMHVNNETGIIQDIQSIANLTSSKGILMHVDAAQSIGKLLINVVDMPIDLLSLSSHKIYGPKGIGALYLRKKPRVKVAAQIHGGAHEQGMRSGTLPTHQIVGMGEAYHIAKTKMQLEKDKMNYFRERFRSGIQDLKYISFNSDLFHSIPNIVNVRFKGLRSKEIIQHLSTLAISAGSACLSKGTEPSYVLRALGQTEEEAASAVRFSWGRFTTLDEIEYAVEKIREMNIG